MKTIALFITAAFALTLSTHAADVKLSDVHLCCQNCVSGVQKVAGKVDGLKAKTDQDEGSVSLSAADKATLQKGVDALVDAGYFGKSSDSEIKVNADTGAKDQKVKSTTVEDLHLCCGQCV